MCDVEGTDLAGIVAIVSIFIVLPALILHYLKTRPQPKVIASHNEAELIALAERLESRVRALESLLAVAPDTPSLSLEKQP
jgi:phage shock protein B